MPVLRKPFRRASNRAVALLLAMSLPQWAGAVQDPFAGLPTLRDDELDLMRGGFENSQGLVFSFAIERAVVVNGELITSTRVVLNDLTPLLTGGMPSAEIISSARNIVQNGLGNTVSTPAGAPTPIAGGPAAPAPAAAATASSAPAAAPAASAPASAPAAAAPVAASIPTQTANATPPVTPMLVQMNAGGQTIVIPNANAIVAAVQNSVNDQIIQTRTTIDAVLSSLSALRANTLANSIRQQALDSVRRP